MALTQTETEYAVEQAWRGTLVFPIAEPIESWSEYVDTVPKCSRCGLIVNLNENEIDDVQSGETVAGTCDRCGTFLTVQYSRETDEYIVKEF